MPPQADATGVASLFLAGFVLLAALFLGYRQYREAKARPPALQPRDEKYFANQDLRRAVGTIVLFILCVALAVGGKMPPRVAGKANLAFIQIWAGIAFLIMALLALALLDIVATRLFAHRQRQNLADEGLSLIEAELRAHKELQRLATSHKSNGRAGHPPLPDPDKNA